MSSFPSTVSLSNPNCSETLNRLSGAGEKLRKLAKKEATTVSSSSIQRDTSSSRLINIINNDLNTSNLPEYEEITVTIRKSEKGFGFELKNGILIVQVFPNSPAFFSGIQVGDIILKVNGTCVKSKESVEIQSMIHECKY
ncbi:unnamed protein product [Brachionus calyciflorus]|uniref:PDZ domain-containing protein n=1 Tax=Brachionus calyciflorus TaxID=104777 RepID=A0A813UHU8_9BILA|nr:unnamed protein product [Brachionus calyciflorus]